VKVTGGIPKFVIDRNGRLVKPSFGQVERRVGLKHVFLNVGGRRAGRKCPVCRGGMKAEVFRNAYGDTALLHVCSMCGHSECEVEEWVEEDNNKR